MVDSIHSGDPSQVIGAEICVFDSRSGFVYFQVLVQVGIGFQMRMILDSCIIHFGFGLDPDDQEITVVLDVDFTRVGDVHGLVG